MSRATDSEEMINKVYKVLKITGSADMFENAQRECRSFAPAAVPERLPLQV